MKSILLILVIFNLSAWAGNEGGHGGDPIAYEFVNLGQKILNELKSDQYHELRSDTGFDVGIFERAVKETYVTSKDPIEMILSGDEKDAINFPINANNKSPRIHVNRDRWQSAPSSNKLILVLHEYMGIMGVERDHFNISVKYAGVLNFILQKLISSSDISSLHYYGVCTSSMPLYARKISCDLKALQQTVACAEADAIQKCRLETGRACGIVDMDLKQYSPPTAPQFNYCKATAIAR